jgi:hypothetical protein
MQDASQHAALRLVLAATAETAAAWVRSQNLRAPAGQYAAGSSPSPRDRGYCVTAALDWDRVRRLFSTMPDRETIVVLEPFSGATPYAPTTRGATKELPDPEGEGLFWLWQQLRCARLREEASSFESDDARNYVSWIHTFLPCMRLGGVRFEVRTGASSSVPPGSWARLPTDLLRAGAPLHRWIAEDRGASAPANPSASEMRALATQLAIAYPAGDSPGLRVILERWLEALQRLAGGMLAKPGSLERLLEARPELQQASWGIVEAYEGLKRLGTQPDSFAAKPSVPPPATPAAPRPVAGSSTAVGVRPAARAPARRVRIAWVVSGLTPGSGGQRNIFRMAHFLQSFGHDVTLFFLNVSETAEQLRALLHEHFYPFEGRVVARAEDLSYQDVVMATHWSTVDPALATGAKAGEIMYFVQDFEPLFTAMGSDYVLAENTYRLGLYHICSGPWCAALLRRDFKAEADFFKFAIDREIYYPTDQERPSNRIVFFAKPEMPRRCFEIGLRALEELNRLKPGLDIVMFGSNQVNPSDVPFPVTVRGMVPTLEGIGDMYRAATLGMVFCTTNPSAVPIEMMACGLPIVDLGRPGNEVNYEGRHDIALLADPRPARMARDILALLGNPRELAARRKTCLEFSSTFPPEMLSARRVEALILGRLASKARAA